MASDLAITIGIGASVGAALSAFGNLKGKIQPA
jgi:hypothetical protein